jgi:hypothetical protein
MDDDDLQAQEWQLPVATTTATVAAAAPLVDVDDQMAQQWRNPPLNNNQTHAQEPTPCDDCWFVSASFLFFFFFLFLCGRKNLEFFLGVGKRV